MNEANVLGLLIQHDLKWDAHTNNLAKKINSANFALYSIRNYLSTNALLQVYYAYIYSRISYGLIFWGVSSSCIDKIFKLQKRSVRTIKKLLCGESCRNHFKSLDMLTVPAMFIYSCAMYRRVRPQLYTLNTDLHGYETRNKNKISIPVHKTTFYEKSPYYITAKIYDHLPLVLKNIKNDMFFKNLLKKILVGLEFYTVSEYFSNQITESILYTYTSKQNITKFS
jgi:hypothetical protein